VKRRGHGKQRTTKAPAQIGDGVRTEVRAGHETRQPRYLVNVTLSPAEAIRAAASRIAAVELDLAEARTALAAAEAAVAAAKQSVPVPNAYTTEQVAQSLGLSRSTVAEMVRRGDIRSVKLGGARRVFRADLDAYIAEVRGRAS
jgi:excisionase family DNA binding protein